jgi:protein-S-isoprenylcysteine O-methyltransferase Ste14
MQKPSPIKYLRDIIIFPFTVTVIIPYLLRNKQQVLLPDNIFIKIVGALFFIAGFYLFLYTNYLFVTIAKGTLAPWSPKQNLVVQGPYRFCRNPMITGVLFILLSEALCLHSTNILLFAIFFFLMNTVFFIKVEEPHLLKNFGEQYKAYKASVPRWIPKLKQYQQSIQ